MRPACITDEEYAAWRAANDSISAPDMRASSPCADCTVVFATVMAAIGKCDGFPGRDGRHKPISADPKRERLRARWREAASRARRKAAAERAQARERMAERRSAQTIDERMDEVARNIARRDARTAYQKTRERERNREYQRRWRAAHPEYLERAREYQRARYWAAKEAAA